MNQLSIDRFTAKVDFTETCWIWIASCDARGYGTFQYGTGEARKAHRVAWELWVGPIPEGQYVCHKCDNPPCVKPEHLFLGSQKDNMHDMWSKGRGNSLPGVRAAAAAHLSQAYCKNGHLRGDHNVYVSPKGTRDCRECRRDADRRRYAREAMGG